LRNGLAIGGATSSTYTLGMADLGASIRLAVSFLDGGGTSEGPLTSAPTTSVQLNSAASGQPLISGTARQGETLTATTSGISDAQGVGAFSYQWRRNGIAISGATSNSYLLTNDDVGSTMSVAVQFIDGFGNAEGPLVSNSTAAVLNINDAPGGLPRIVGSLLEHQTLTADGSAITDVDGLGTFNHQWYRNGLAISGATSSSYTLSSADIGGQISLQVSFLDGQGTLETIQSALSSPVQDNNDAPALTLVPRISNLREDFRSASSLAVADIVVVDDGLGSNSISLSGRDAALFELAVGGTQLHLKAGAELDFETLSTLRVTVQVDDISLAGGPEDTRNFSLAITDVNEQPHLRLVQSLYTVGASDSRATAMAVATLVLSDDALGTTSLVLSGQHASLFRLNGNQLELRADAKLPVDTTLQVAVQAVDATAVGLPTAATPVSVQVIAVASPPAFSVPSGATSSGESTSESKKDTQEQTKETLANAKGETPLAPFVPNGNERSHNVTASEAPEAGPQPAEDPSEQTAAVHNQTHTQDRDTSDTASRRSWETSAPASLHDFAPSYVLPISSDFSFLSPDSLLWEKLDSLQEEVASNMQFDGIVMGSVSAVTSGLTVGYVVWMIRGGVIASTLLAQLPAWKYMDAMVVLAHTENEVDDEGGSLEAIVDQDLDEEYEMEETHRVDELSN
ncbi:MAG: hypothetical protein KDA45_00405, partial [Planctomycetales bacterium]|nr:hypothetical protein [Planctomycetales bacterium]